MGSFSAKAVKKMEIHDFKTIAHIYIYNHFHRIHYFFCRFSLSGIWKFFQDLVDVNGDPVTARDRPDTQGLTPGPGTVGNSPERLASLAEAQ